MQRGQYRYLIWNQGLFSLLSKLGVTDFVSNRYVWFRAHQMLVVFLRENSPEISTFGIMALPRICLLCYATTFNTVMLQHSTPLNFGRIKSDNKLNVPLIF